MCGIMAYVGREEALPIVLDGLRRLEYRGYDSAGVAVLLPPIQKEKSKKQKGGASDPHRDSGIGGTGGAGSASNWAVRANGHAVGRVEAAGQVVVRRAPGKLDRLAHLVAEEATTGALRGTVAIGHT